MTVSVANAQENEKNDSPVFTTFPVSIFKDKYKPDAVLLDVRSPEEYKDGHIKGAISMNIEDKNFSEKIKFLKKENNIFVYCAEGGRSREASEILTRAGFPYVYNLNGGYKDLVKAGMPGVR